jgi:2-keto-4-pentenoate hydratase/2-oxohepta-3-ene-1,7-dioic acid hydratase in catechol pathway
MKLLSYEFEGAARLGALVDDGVVDIGRRLGVNNLRQLLETGKLAAVAELAGTQPDHALADIAFLPLIPDPAHFYCVGVNYADHLKEVQDAGIARPKPKHPSLFPRFPESLIGHDQPLQIPKVSDEFDYEAELAVVIGKGGRYINETDALNHVAGYTCFNDGSVRDWQYHSSQVTSGKNFWQTGGFGPWLVTADEIPDPGCLDIKLLLNGRPLQESNTRHLIFNVAQIIAYASALIPLKPGDVIATGTPSGVGFSRTPPIFMKAGDICEVQIEKIGTLRNTVEKAVG